MRGPFAGSLRSAKNGGHSAVSAGCTSKGALLVFVEGTSSCIFQAPEISARCTLQVLIRRLEVCNASMFLSCESI